MKFAFYFFDIISYKALIKMEDDKTCERSVRCPIYTGLLESNQILIKLMEQKK